MSKKEIKKILLTTCILLTFMSGLLIFDWIVVIPQTEQKGYDKLSDKIYNESISNKLAATEDAKATTEQNRSSNFVLVCKGNIKISVQQIGVYNSPGPGAIPVEEVIYPLSLTFPDGSQESYTKNVYRGVTYYNDNGSGQLKITKNDGYEVISIYKNNKKIFGDCQVN